MNDLRSGLYHTSTQLTWTTTQIKISKFKQQNIIPLLVLVLHIICILSPFILIFTITSDSTRTFNFSSVNQLTQFSLFRLQPKKKDLPGQLCPFLSNPVLHIRYHNQNPEKKNDVKTFTTKTRKHLGQRNIKLTQKQNYSKTSNFCIKTLKYIMAPTALTE